MTRIPIHGIGVVGPGSIGVDGLRELLGSGVSAVADISRFDTSGLGSHRAALVGEFRAKDYVSPLKLRRMNTLSRHALAATKMALSDAGLETLEVGGGIGVAIGTAFGPVQTSVEYLQEYVEKGAALAPPQLFAESVANAPGSHIAIDLGLQGFNLTFTQRESSMLAATLYAASQIAKGSVHGAIAGGIDEMNEMAFSVLDRIGALAHASGSMPEEPRPFDRSRNGIAVGEGAAVLLLGDVGATSDPYCHLAGFGMAKDPTASISDWGTDAGAVVRAMRGAIDDAGIAIEDVDAVWASANSSLRGDRLEYRAIQALFGARVPRVVATKGYFGEYAAAGGLHLASAALAIRDQEIPLSIGFREGESEMAFTLAAKQTEAGLRHVLVNSISAGGGIISAVISRSDRD